MAAANYPTGPCGTHGWHVNKEDAREHFALALESGINFFDTADVYSAGLSEEITGHWLREMASRDDIVVATKVHGPMGAGPNRRGLSRKHIIEACEQLAAAAENGLHRSVSDSSLGSRARRLRRRWTRSIRWCAPARCATWARAAWRRGSSQGAVHGE